MSLILSASLLISHFISPNPSLFCAFSACLEADGFPTSLVACAICEICFAASERLKRTSSPLLYFGMQMRVGI
jgi:hypothetical protein